MEYLGLLPTPDRPIPRMVSAAAQSKWAEIFVGNVLGGFAARPHGPFPVGNPVAFEDRENGPPFGTGIDGVRNPPNNAAPRNLTTSLNTWATEIFV